MQTRDIVHPKKSATKQESAPYLLAIHPPTILSTVSTGTFQKRLRTETSDREYTPTVVKGQLIKALSQEFLIPVLMVNVKHSKCVNRWIHVTEVEFIRRKLHLTQIREMEYGCSLEKTICWTNLAFCVHVAMGEKEK